MIKCSSSVPLRIHISALPNFLFQENIKMISPDATTGICRTNKYRKKGQGQENIQKAVIMLSLEVRYISH